MKAPLTARRTPTPPVETSTPSYGLKVRRFVLADIPKIVKLAEEAYGESVLKVAPFSGERVKRLLNNNKNNDLLHADIMMSNGDIVGVFMAAMTMDMYVDENAGYDSLFYIKPDYRDNAGMMIESYKEWGRRRGIREAYASDYFMPGFNLNGMTEVGITYKVEL